MLEVLYDFAAPEKAWLESVHRAAARFMPGTRVGLIGSLQIVGTSPDELRGVGRGEDGWTTDPLLLTLASQALSDAPASYLRARVAQPVGTEVQLLGRDYAQMRHGNDLRALGYADWLNVSAMEDDGTVLNMGFALPAVAGPWPAALVNEWHTVARHVVACVRLRAELRSGDERLEAVLSPSGHVIDAMGMAVAHRDLLRSAVKHVERSRARGRDRPSALDARPPRVGGRWTIVDRFDADGKHFVVAYAMVAPKTSLAKLSPRERRIAEHIAEGWSMKRISTETGLSLGAIASYTHRACKKLGVRGRVALARAMR